MESLGTGLGLVRDYVYETFQSAVVPLAAKTCIHKWVAKLCVVHQKRGTPKVPFIWTEHRETIYHWKLERSSDELVQGPMLEEF